jgi:hypothetical protein
MYPQYLKREIVSVLTNAQKDISSGWCRRHKALTDALRVCDPSSIAAGSYCLLGAVERNAKGDMDLERVTLEVLERHISKRHRGLYARASVTRFNDSCRSFRGPQALIQLALDYINGVAK